MMDMHTHTRASDGLLTPSALLTLARQNGVRWLAITDHDTVAGVEEARTVLAAKADDEAPITLVPGVELTARWTRGVVHVVGLGLDTAHPVLRKGLADQQARRPARAARIAERLAALGHADTLAGARALAGHSSIGRVHFARHLVARGVVHNAQEAFRRYLGDGKPAAVPCEWPMLSEAVHWIRAAGGVAVLAHPLKYRLTRVRLTALMDEFVAAGGEAVELPDPDEKAANVTWLCRGLRERHLAVSVGSDFHGHDRAWNRPGRCRAVPDHCRPVWTLPPLAALMADAVAL